MNKKLLLQIALILGLVGLNIGTFAYTSQKSQTNYEAQLRQVWSESDIDVVAMRTNNIYELNSAKSDVSANLQKAQNDQPICDDIHNGEIQLGAELTFFKMPKGYSENEFIRVDVGLKNTGNMTWYGDSHPCGNYAKIRLGNAENPEDPHVLWNDFNFVGNNWLHNEFKNRIIMNEKEVAPGEEGSFSFWVETPIAQVTKTVEVVDIEGEEGGDEATQEKKVTAYKWLYERHTLSPVIGETWLDIDIPVTLKVGELPPKEAEKLRFLNAKQKNYSLKDFAGEKNMYVTLSDQKGYLRYGETPFHSYTISSGAWDTPTPVGDHKIHNKQELRIGGAAPHYRMPYWMGLKTFGSFTGYGLHEVPYLGESREKSQFYQNGLHYDLGRNVSHGCVRSAPEDAEFAFEFGEIDMPVYVRKGLEEEVYDVVIASVERNHN